MLINKVKNGGGEIELDDKTADQMLDNIFRACDKTPGVMPIESLKIREKNRNTNFAFCKVISVVLLIVLLLTPFMFIPSSLKMTTVPNGVEMVTLKFSVNSLLPVMNIKAQIDGNTLDVIPVKYNDYTAKVEQNGKLNVDVTLINGRSSSFNMIISTLIIDKETPIITDSNLDGDELTVFVSDKDAGVSFEQAYAVDEEGRKVYPLSFNREAGYIVFKYRRNNLNLFIPDQRGNTLHAVVTSLSVY